MIIGYARVSTPDQSLAVQLSQLQAAAAEKIFQEFVSGSKSDRPELATMLDQLRPGDTIMVCKLDRLARSTRDLLNITADLDKRQVGFKVLNINLDTATPTGKLMLTMLGAIAQFERELMLERQAEGIERAKAEGKFTGRQPTVRNQKPEIQRLLAMGLTKKEVAKQLDVSLPSIYRVLAEVPEQVGTTPTPPKTVILPQPRTG